MSRLFPRDDALRQQAPVDRIVIPDGTPPWRVSGSDNVMATAKDRRFVMDIRHVLTLGEQEGPHPPPDWMEPFVLSMIFTDPPDHACQRRLAQPAFAPKLLGSLQPEIQAAADELPDRGW